MSGKRGFLFYSTLVILYSRWRSVLNWNKQSHSENNHAAWCLSSIWYPHNSSHLVRLGVAIKWFWCQWYRHLVYIINPRYEKLPRWDSCGCLVLGTRVAQVTVSSRHRVIEPSGNQESPARPLPLPAPHPFSLSSSPYLIFPFLFPPPSPSLGGPKITPTLPSHEGMVAPLLASLVTCY